MKTLFTLALVVAATSATAELYNHPTEGLVYVQWGYYRLALNGNNEPSLPERLQTFDNHYDCERQVRFDMAELTPGIVNDPWTNYLFVCNPEPIPAVE